MAAQSSAMPGAHRLNQLAERAGYRVERARVRRLWQLIDGEGELVRTPEGANAWPPEEAERHLKSIAPIAPS